MSITLWCLFFAGLLHLISKIPLARAQAQSAVGYDNKNPREQQHALDGWGRRALAAHQNQIESFPLFAAGVLVATVSGITSSAVTYLAVIFIVARIAYIYCYIKDIATLRSIIWCVGLFSSLALMCSPAWS